MDRILVEALAPVLADVRSTAAPEPRLEDDERDPGLQSTAFMRAVDGAGRGVGVLKRSSLAERVVEAADHVQEWVIESGWSAEGSTTWPNCPGHPGSHPMLPEVRGGTAVRVCPRGSTVPIPIGTLRVAYPRTGDAVAGPGT